MNAHNSDGEKHNGTLFVVATPIGNLGDLSSRAVEVLGAAELIVAEDTRRTGLLLSHLGLSREMTSCHKFNEAKTIEGLLSRLEKGQSLALVTDGGTPAVSDPGYRLVAAAHEAGHRVEPIPGACAAIAAVCASGFPADRFHFAGFLPAKSSARRRAIDEFKRFGCTVVIYEAPHRLLACLEDLLDQLGDQPATVCREMTKLHEEIRRGTLAQLLADYRGRDKIRGEIVLCLPPNSGIKPASKPHTPVIGGWHRSPDEDEQLKQLHQTYQQALTLEEGDSKRALRRLAREMNRPRSEIKKLLGLK